MANINGKEQIRHLRVCPDPDILRDPDIQDSPSSVPDLGRVAKLVNFNSISQFCHFGDETGFTLKSHHLRRVTFWVLWVLITKLKKIKENYHKQFPNAFTGKTVKTVNSAFYCKCFI